MANPPGLGAKVPAARSAAPHIGPRPRAREKSPNKSALCKRYPRPSASPVSHDLRLRHESHEPPSPVKRRGVTSGPTPLGASTDGARVGHGLFFLTPLVLVHRYRPGGVFCRRPLEVGKGDARKKERRGFPGRGISWENGV